MCIQFTGAYQHLGMFPVGECKILLLAKLQIVCNTELYPILQRST